MNARITINGRFLTRPATGVDRFAIELLRCWLPAHGADSDARIVVPRHAARLDKGELPTAHPLGTLDGHGWEQLELPVYCRNDMLLNLCNTGPIAQRSQLAVLHDVGTVAYASSYSYSFRAWYRVLFSGLMRRARIIATVSSFSASDLMRYFRGKAGRIEVIPESGEHILRAPADRSVLERLGLKDRPYILCVGSLAPHKNFAALARAAVMLSDLKVEVVAVGGGNSRVFASVARGVARPAGHVTDAELRALYENARCFAFPSLYEGFGLPPLEAMQCGCPAVVSRRAALPEVCGDGALYCDPDDPADIARQLRAVLSSQLLWTEMRERGIARARAFSWRKAADHLQQILSR
jgi:glycosyltransferase involved in cell wall biosynthesis